MKAFSGSGKPANTFRFASARAFEFNDAVEEFRELMEVRQIDAVRNDIDGGQPTVGPVRAQPAERAFKLRSGKRRVDDDPVGLFERGGVALMDDVAVERNVAGDFQPIAIRPKHPQIMLEAPDVVQDENQRGIDLFDQPCGLIRRKDITASRIGRIDGQAAIPDDLAGIADAEIVNFVAIRERPMMLCITRVKPVPWVLKPMAMIFTSAMARSFGFVRLARGEEQSQSLELPGRPPVPAMGDGETRLLQIRNQFVDGEFRIIVQRTPAPWPDDRR